MKTIVLSSLEKVFPEIEPNEEKAVSDASCFNNEPLSFQIVYKLVGEKLVLASVFARITTELPVSMYSVGYVPVLQSYDPNLNDHYRAGLFFDRLLEKKVNPKVEKKHYPSKFIYVEDDADHLSAQSESWRTVWVTVNERKKKIKGGTHHITLRFSAKHHHLSNKWYR